MNKMPVVIRTDEEIALMRESGHLLELVHQALHAMIRPGVSTAEINRAGDRKIREFGGVPNFLDYDGYPASICVSVNDEVVHGIPSDDRILKEGDIVSLDAGLIWKGYHSDAARTWIVGRAATETERLVEDTRMSFFEGMRFARAGHHLYEISAAIGAYAAERGYGVVEELCGHGIGTHLHEPPQIPNYRQKGRGILLVPGMVLAIEPMINLGTKEIEWMSDGWTVRTADRKPSAHYENTVLITDGDPELLTCTGFDERELIRTMHA